MLHTYLNVHELWADFCSLAARLFHENCAYGSVGLSYYLCECDRECCSYVNALAHTAGQEVKAELFPRPIPMEANMESKYLLQISMRIAKVSSGCQAGTAQLRLTAYRGCL